MNTNSGEGFDLAAPSDIDQATFDVRHLSLEQLAALGVSHIAYVKEIMVQGIPGFAIHAADGTPLAVAQDRDVAIAAIVQHEMHALSVH